MFQSDTILVGNNAFEIPMLDKNIPINGVWKVDKRKMKIVQIMYKIATQTHCANDLNNTNGSI